MSHTHIVFPTPCHEDWERMTPDGRARFCLGCEKKVHDLNLYTPEEIDDLLTKDPTPACLRANILPDGRVETLASRFGKLVTAAVAAPAVFIALSATGAAADPTAGSISGSVTIADAASVKVTARGEGLKRSARVASDGSYRIDHLPPGTYSLRFSASTKKWSVDQVDVRADFETVRNTQDPALPPPITFTPMPTAGIPLPSPIPAKVDPPSPAPTG